MAEYDRIEIRLLGRFAVRRGIEEVSPGEFRGRLVRTLVRILVSRRGQFVSKDELVEALWQERPPADPNRNLEILLVRARRALRDPSLILTRAGGYSYAEDDRCEVDAEIFLARVEAGRRYLALGKNRPALRSFEQALAKWSGEPLPEDAYAEWAQEYRRVLARANLEALEGGARAALALSDPARAVALAERAVMREPLREGATLLLIHAMAASGDQAGALAGFEALRQRLAEELGIDPSPEAAGVQLRILRGESLALPPSGPHATPPLAPRHGFDFVGREREIEVILATLVSPPEDAPRVVLLSGVAGAGKTRLLSELEQGSPVPVLSARAYLPERDEAWSLTRSILRECLALDAEAALRLSDHGARALVEVIPELEDLRPVPALSLDAEARRAMAIEGALAVLEASAAGGAMVLADDIQWGDPTSLHLLHLVVERLPGIGLILAYRPEEVSPTGPVGALLADIRRHGAREIDLGPLPSSAIAQLITDEEIGHILAERTDGTPLAIVEVIRTLVQAGVAEPLPDGRWRLRSEGAAEIAMTAASAGHRQAIRLRAERLPEPQRVAAQVLSLAAREVPARVVAATVGLDQMETLELLEGLLRAGLARTGDHGWATAHDVVGETLAGELPADKRRRLHTKLAAALETEGEELSLIAPHLAAGGDTAGAARAFAEAAGGALDHFDNDEAVRLADSGLSLEPSPPTRGQLLETRAEARARKGDLSAATDGLREALAVIPKGTGHSRVLARLALLQAGADDYVRGAELADLALTEAGQDPAARANALAIRARIDLNIGDLEACRLGANEALALLQRLGDAHGRARVLDTLAVATLEEGRIPESIDLFDRVAILFTAVGDLFRAVMPRATRGYALTLAARFEDALADIDQALGLARMLRFPEGETYALFQRCLPLEALGRQAEGLESAASALALAERLGHREWIAASLYYLGRLQRDQDPDRAEESLGRSLELAGGMPIWTTLAASDLAMVMIARGRFGDADTLVARALQAGERNRKGLYPAHLAETELAAARGDQDASSLAERALAEALAGGHLMSVPRLQELAGRR